MMSDATVATPRAAVALHPAVERSIDEALGPVVGAVDEIRDASLQQLRNIEAIALSVQILVTSHAQQRAAIAELSARLARLEKG
jgi:hypothetical protein